MAAKDSLDDFFPENRQECKFGTECYRLNPSHLRMNKHDHIEALFPRFVASNGTDEEIKGSNPGKVLEQLQVLLRSYQDFKKSAEMLGFELIQLNKEKQLAEYSDVQDRVLNYIKPTHNWQPIITKIEKISNPSLEKKFEAAKTRCFGEYIALKFHGTGKEGIDRIPWEGFKISKVACKQLMFGLGIYFATDSSKSAQEIYTKGTKKLLLCDVLLGNTKTVISGDSTLTLEKIRAEGFDSILAPRDSKSTGGVLYDEFVIYDPDQAIPRYIIHYRTGGSNYRTGHDLLSQASSSGSSGSDDDSSDEDDSQEDDSQEDGSHEDDSDKNSSEKDGSNEDSSNEDGSNEDGSDKDSIDGVRIKLGLYKRGPAEMKGGMYYRIGQNPLSQASSSSCSSDSDEDSSDKDDSDKDDSDKNSSDEDASHQVASNEDSSDEDCSNEDGSDEDGSDQDSRDEDSSDENGWYEDGSNEDSWDEDGSIEDSSDKNSSDKDARHQIGSDEDSSDEDGSHEDGSNQDGSDKDNSDEDSWDEDGSNEDVSDKNSSDEDSSNEDGSNEDGSDEDGRGKDRSDEDGWDEDCSNEDGSAEDSSSEDVRDKDSSNEDGSNEDGSNEDSSNEDSSDKDTCDMANIKLGLNKRAPAERKGGTQHRTERDPLSQASSASSGSSDSDEDNGDEADSDEGDNNESDGDQDNGDEDNCKEDDSKEVASDEHYIKLRLLKRQLANIKERARAICQKLDRRHGTENPASECEQT